MTEREYLNTLDLARVEAMKHLVMEMNCSGKQEDVLVRELARILSELYALLYPRVAPDKIAGRSRGP